MQLRQDRSVEHYITQFTALTLQVPDLTADQVKLIFVKGLKPSIRVQAEINKDNLDLESLMILADRLETIHRQQRDVAQHIARPRFNPDNRQAAPGYRQHHAPMPMELGAMRAPHRPHVRFSPNGTRKPLSDKERQYLLANNGCTFCRRLGHTHEECRARQNNAARPSIQPGNGYGKGN